MAAALPLNAWCSLTLPAREVRQDVAARTRTCCDVSITHFVPCARCSWNWAAVEASLSSQLWPFSGAER